MLLKICYRLGGVLLIAGLLLPLWHFGLAAHVLAAGALLFGGAQMTEPRQEPLLTVRRLRRQQMLGALMLIITGALMLTRYYHIAPFRGNEWMFTLMIAGVIETYTAFRIDAEEKREQGTR